ncbi:MAG: ATP-binding cassette, subfamily bacterial MsbA, partial [Frankiaceae bacterium]|nr:ATP-binding cassette, subfamily bacterial MsbA [Frankiaceae bacterium]
SGVLHRLTGAQASPHVLLGSAVVLVLLIAGLTALSDYWSTWLMQSAGERIGNDLRQALFTHLQSLSLRYHGTQRVGDLTTRLTADVDRVQDLLVQVLSVLVPNGLLVGGMAITMLVVDPTFALVAFLASPVMIVAIYRSTRQVKRASRQARRYGGEMAAAASETLSSIKVVQAFTLEDHTRKRFDRLNLESLNATLRAARLQARFGPVVDGTAALSTAAVLWFGAVRVLDGKMTVGVLLVFLTYLTSLYKPVKALSKLGFVIGRGVASGERIAAVLEEEPDVKELPDARPAGRVRGDIEFENVHFSYGREPVLRGVNVQIQAGETVALIGSSGAGKSTLAGLVPRFFDVTDGSVLIDGVDVRRYSLRSLRDQVALVLQDTALFEGTLLENILCGRLDAAAHEVMRAAALAHVDEFADRLPDGYQTVLSEHGMDLSGGQRQRVAIARALLKDAPILILDEPTSALDGESEAAVMDAIGNLIRGRTTLIIAHRLSTIAGADRVIALGDGRACEVDGPTSDAPATLRRRPTPSPQPLNHLRPNTRSVV